MKRVLTDNIVANVRKQGFPKSSLDHLQDAPEEAIEALLSAFGVDPTKVTVLSGCVIDDSAAPDFTITEGWAAYDGKVYKVDASAFTAAGGETAVFALAESFSANDPVGFDDNNEFNVNQTLKLALQSGGSGSGVADYDEAVRYDQPAFEVVPAINGWTGNVLFHKNAQGVVIVRFDLLNATSKTSNIVCEIPEEYLPKTSVVKLVQASQSTVPVIARAVFSSSTGDLSIFHIELAEDIDSFVINNDLTYTTW